MEESNVTQDVQIVQKQKQVETIEVDNKVIPKTFMVSMPNNSVDFKILSDILNPNFISDEMKEEGNKEYVGAISYFMWNTSPVPEEKQHKVKLVLGSPAPHDIIEEFMERFNFKFMEGYGLTEIGQCTWMRPGEVFRVGSCGKEAPGYEIKIGDPETDEEVPRGEIGEIIVRPRTPNVMLYYYNKMPEKTVQDFRNFWFHTGDAGRMDKDGYIYFVDRVKDYLRCKGENISSFEVEKIVGSHPDVEESGAIGVKAEAGRYAEDELMIVVVPKKGKTIDPVKLIKFLEPKMPYFMIPRFIRFEESLPKTGTQRVQKNKLRDKGITKDTWDMKKAGYKVKR